MTEFSDELYPAPAEPPPHPRRTRRSFFPMGAGKPAGQLADLARLATPSVDFFLFSFAAGVVLGAAMLLDSPALYLLAALLAPLMTPWLGLSISSAIGATGFFFRSLMALLISSLIFGLLGAAFGALAGWIGLSTFIHLPEHAYLNWADLLLLSIGAVLTILLVLRNPQARPMVSSVALAYTLYLPIGAAGFALAADIPQVWSSALSLFGLHLIWSMLVGMVTLALSGLRPARPAGSIFGFVVLIAAAGLIFVLGQANLGGLMLPAPTLEPVVFTATVPVPSLTPTASLTPRPLPTSTVEVSLTPTITRTPTATLVPSLTPTITFGPTQVPLYGLVAAGESKGVVVRSEPDGPIIFSLLNGSLVEIFGDTVNRGGVLWIQIRAADGKTGWVVRSLLATATPAPGR